MLKMAKKHGMAWHRYQNSTSVEVYPGLLLTSTCWRRTPGNTPTRVSTIVIIRKEVKLDNVACTCDDGRQRGANIVVSNVDITIVGAAADHIHQGCPVTVLDYQVVTITPTGTRFHVHCIEL